MSLDGTASLQRSFVFPENLRVVLIDDSDSDRHLFSFFLKEKYAGKAEVVSFRTLSEVKRKIEDLQADIAFLNLELPDSSQSKTIDFISELSHKAPVVVLTGSDSISLLEESIESGGSDFLLKNEISASQIHRVMYSAVRRRWLEKSKKQLEDRAVGSQKMEALGKLTAGVAHDFNNKLAIINGSVSYLQPDLEPSIFEEVKARVNRAIESATNLTKKLLAFGKDRDLQMERVNLSDAVEKSLQLVKSYLGDGVRLVKHFENTPLTVSFDVTHLDQIITNLVINARDALLEGIENGKNTVENACITVSTARSGKNFVALSVADNGPGIKQKNFERVFEPYFTTKSEDRGTGLGLSVVYGLVKQNGAEIKLRSEEGIGTEFSILIKVADSVVTEYAEEKSDLS